jgi:hypothetical protein
MARRPITLPAGAAHDVYRMAWSAVRIRCRRRGAIQLLVSFPARMKPRTTGRSRTSDPSGTPIVTAWYDRAFGAKERKWLGSALATRTTSNQLHGYRFAVSPTPSVRPRVAPLDPLVDRAVPRQEIEGACENLERRSPTACRPIVLRLAQQRPVVGQCLVAGQVQLERHDLRVHVRVGRSGVSRKIDL